MLEAGPYLGTTFAEDASVGTISPADVANAGAEDGSLVTWTMLTGEEGKYLKATNFLIDFPVDAMPLGIVVRIKKHASVPDAITDLSVRLVVGGVPDGGGRQNFGNPWSDVPALVTYGSSRDLWELEKTAAEWRAILMSADFGVAVAPQASLADAVANIDSVTVAIYYDLPGASEFGHDSPMIEVGDGMGDSN